MVPTTALIAALAYSLATPSLTPRAHANQALQTPDLIADIAEGSLPAVVSIYSTSLADPGGVGDPRGRSPRGHEGYGPQQGAGSGVIVQPDGLILTNNHVIEGANVLQVELADGRSFSAEVVGRDPASDLGVIRLTGENAPKNLPTLQLADSDEVRLGEVVLAVGNPFGLSGTVTMGIVSATGRGGRGLVDYGDFIQTDAAINPGNSGGALVDLEGRLVGINTAIVSRSGGYNGIGFAIPSNLAGDVMGSILQNGHMVRGWLGVSIQDVNEGIAAAFGAQVTEGALIAEVMPDTPAARAGLRPGDIVIAVDAEPVENAEQFKNVIALRGVREVRLHVLRDGEPQRVTARLQEKDEVSTATTTPEPGPIAQGPLAGVKLAPLGPHLAERLGRPDEVGDGVAVASVTPMSDAASAGLQSGDLIIEVNHQPVRTLKDVAAAVATSGSALLRVRRGEATTFVLIR